MMEASNDFNIKFGNEGPLSVIDANGNALVMWEQSDGIPDGATRKIRSRRYVAGQGWAAETTIPGVLVNSSAIAVAGRLLVDGAGVVTWVDDNLSARRYTPTGGWATSVVTAANATIGSLADAKIDANGTIHALRRRDGNVWHATLAAGASQWSDWVAVGGTTDAVTGGVKLALGPTGAIAVWRERNPGDSFDSVWANRWVSGTWQTRVRIEEVLTNARGEPAVAMDASGNALVAWHQGDSLYVNRFNATTATWGTAQEFDAGQVGSSFDARIGMVMHADGRALIAWNSGIFALKTMSYAPTSGFAAPTTVAPYSIDRTLQMDRDGRIVLVHRADPGFPNASTRVGVYTLEQAWGGSWSAPLRLDTGPGDILDDVAFAMNSAGQAVTTWAQNDLVGSNVRNSLWSNLRR